MSLPVKPELSLSEILAELETQSIKYHAKGLLAMKPTAQALHSLQVKILAQELDTLIWATGGIKEFTEDGKIYIPKKIEELQDRIKQLKQEI